MRLPSFFSEENMETLFIILALVGAFACGFFVCLSGIYLSIIHWQNRMFKRGNKHDRHKRDQY